jgi:hypothetical protein
MKKVIIAIDFDGVISKINKNNDLHPKELVENADVFIRKLYREGYYIIIWTCRTSNNLYLAEKFLEEHKIPYNRINDNADTHYQNFKNASRKIYADVYIDDKQIGGLPSWEEIYKYIHKITKKLV